ncbi:DUF1501 domain-containing protein [Lentisphaera profundi]|uniref:DUF1501 domain-containing protein n=1 Tax=Lentisphaera profundi TaxID=1658616 RepID=A0ABY7W2J5_9BACT|nr:DUF1501 domain-containing protein [Lentisphaera profundi]WDE99221.1 DUF1501 domain-containing protein [Lentisphaera profundi]
MIHSRRDFFRLSSAAALSGLHLNAFANKATPTGPHFKGTAKRVIFLNMTGAASHVDTFDYKPALFKQAGKRGKYGGKLLPPIKDFKRCGRSGLPISQLLPNISTHADKLCLLHGMSTDQPNHPQAQTKIHTGNVQFARPSLGAWIMYGLGSLNKSLPGFITLYPPSSRSANFSSAFLPSQYQGTAVGQAIRGNRANSGGDDFPNINNPQISKKLQRKQLDFIQNLNEQKLRNDKFNPNIKGIQDSYEMAYRMQDSMPEILDLSKESSKTQSLYGIGNETTDKFGRQCLLARRFAESGARFIELSHGSWDHHLNLKNDLPARCHEIDKPISGLLTDLKQRGLLKDTLVVWASEFGRTPESPNGDGRDHNPKGFTTWMAGGGVKGGFRYGSTDEMGYEAESGRMSIHDWHATILHILGLDHERLTYKYAGRDFRPTDVYGDVARDILS